MADSTDLLKLLNSVTTAPRPASTSASAPKDTIEASEFTELLEKARTGQLASNRQVTLDSDAGFSLSDVDLARLSLAADKAEAAGIHKAVVFLDDKALLLDVQSRKVLGSADLSSGVAVRQTTILAVLFDRLLVVGGDRRL